MLEAGHGPKVRRINERFLLLCTICWRAVGERYTITIDGPVPKVIKTTKVLVDRANGRPASPIIKSLISAGGRLGAHAALAVKQRRRDGGMRVKLWEEVLGHVLDQETLALFVILVNGQVPIYG